MKLRVILTLVVVITSCFSSIFAQNDEVGFPCGHNEMQQKLWKENPKALIDYEQILKNLSNYETIFDSKRGTKKYIIPIVFHILHENGIENISDAQVIDQVKILNRDYNKLNADTSGVQDEFKDIIANCNFEFRLATIDPMGNCTNGINHYYTHLTNNASDDSKINQWNRGNYLNVWVVKTIGQAGVAGYAYFPNSAMGFNFKGDGVIILHNYIGSIGTSNDNRSRALTHEIGHYLGLAHVWGNTNDPEVGCGDDGISDTPKTMGHKNCTKSSIGNKQTCSTDILFQYKMDSVKVNSGITDPTPLIKTDSATFTSFAAHGVSANSLQAKAFAFNNWATGGVNKDTTLANQTGTLDASKYYEFSVSAKNKGLLTIDQLKFKIFRDTNGIRSFSVRSSVDNYTTNLPITATNSAITRINNNEVYIKKDTTRWFLSTVKTSDKAFADLTTGEKVTFRIYGWNAEDASGIFGLDSVSVIARSGAIENIENYMEYSYCSKMFTNEQAKLMRINLESGISSRKHLWSDSNLIATGTYTANTVSACKPKADFYMNLKNDVTNVQTTICAGEAVKFNDISSSGLVTSRTWIFENGTPSTSTDVNPEVTFNTAGGHDVTLIVSNANGTDTLYRKNYVYVTGFSSETGQLIENFNDGYSWDWHIEDFNTNSSRFGLSSSNGKGKSQCLKLDNYRDITKFAPYEEGAQYYTRLAGTKHTVITPAINLATTTNVTVSFDYAFATDAYYDSLITDVLNIYVSRDCGESWSLKKSISGPRASVNSVSSNGLVTAGNSSGTPFLPNADNLWKNMNFPFTVNNSDTKTRFKFEFIPSKYANNLYIDNLAITGTLQIEESPITKMDINVYPNPTTSNDGIVISYNANNENVTFELIDAQGKTLAKEVNTAKNGQQETKMSFGSKLEAGCYFVKASQGSFTSTYKVIVM
jgi:PKD repeat protein